MGVCCGQNWLAVVRRCRDPRWGSVGVCGGRGFKEGVVGSVGCITSASAWPEVWGLAHLSFWIQESFLSLNCLPFFGGAGDVTWSEHVFLILDLGFCFCLCCHVRCVLDRGEGVKAVTLLWSCADLLGSRARLLLVVESECRG